MLKSSSEQTVAREIQRRLVQMSCGPEPDDNLPRPSTSSRRRRARARKSSACPNFFRRNISASAKMRALRSRGANSRSDHRETVGDCAKQTEDRAHRFAVRKARAGRLSQHRCHVRHRRHRSRHLPQDAHSRRPALLREVLLHSRRSRLQALSTPTCGQARHAGLLGSVVSRRRAPHRSAGRTACFSIPPRSAGIPPRRPNSARRNTMPGGQSSERTPSPTASMSRW